MPQGSTCSGCTRFLTVPEDVRQHAPDCPNVALLRKRGLLWDPADGKLWRWRFLMVEIQDAARALDKLEDDGWEIFSTTLQPTPVGGGPLAMTDKPGIAMAQLNFVGVVGIVARKRDRDKDEPSEGRIAKG